MGKLRYGVVAGLLLGVVAVRGGAGDNLDGYLKDGKLTEALEIRDVQGGVAGFTGKYVKFDPDGKWSSGMAFNQKLTEEKSGTLSKEDLNKLAKALAKHDLLKLKNEGKPTTNPHVLSIKFGKVDASLTLKPGAMLPKVDPNSTGVEQRYVGILEVVRELTGAKDEKKK